MLVVLLFCVSGLLYYAYQNSFNLPAPIIGRIKNLVKVSTNLDFDAQSLKLSVKEHILYAKKLSLTASGTLPFLEIDEAIVYFASGTGPLDFYHSRVMIEKIQINGLSYDISRPQPQADSSKEIQDLKFPAREILVQNLKIKTPLITIDAPEFVASLLKSGKNANIHIDLGSDFFGGTGKILAVVDQAGGFSRARLHWKQPDFAKFLPLTFFAGLHGLTFTKGEADINLQWEGNLLDRVNHPKEKIADLFNQELFGTLAINDCQLSSEGKKSAVNLMVSRQQDKPWEITGALVTEARGEMKLSGNCTANESAIPNFLVQAEGRNIKLTESNFLNLGINLANTKPGELDFTGIFVGNDGKISAEGLARGRKWKYQEKLIHDADLKWAISEDLHLAIAGRLETEIGNLIATAGIQLAGPQKLQGQVSGDLQRIDLQSLKPFIESPVIGKCSGPFTVVFNLDKPENTTYDIDLEMRDGGFYSFKPDLLTTRIYGTGTNWNLENPVAFFEESGKITHKGSINSQAISGKLSVSNVDLRNFELSPQMVAGYANLEAEISGPLEEPHVRGQVWGENINIFGLQTESFKAQLNYKDHLLNLAPMVAKIAEDSAVDGFLSINLDTGEMVALKLSLQKLALTSLEKFFPENMAIGNDDGFVGGAISFRKSRGQNLWEFSLDGANMVVEGQTIDSAFLEGSILGKHGEIKSLFLRAFGGSLTLSGQFVDLNRFSGAVEVEAIKLENIQILEDLLPEIKGELSCQGDIDWSAENKTGKLTVFARNLQAMGRELGNFGGEVTIDRLGMRVTSGEFDQLGIKVDGNIAWAGNKPYKAEISLVESDLSFIPLAHGIKTFAPGGLVVTGNCLVQGDVNTKMPDNIDFKIESLRIQKENDVIVSNRPMQILYQNNGVEIRSLELKYRLGVIGVEGILAPGKNMAIMINGKDFSVKALGSLFDLPNWNYDGSLSLTARVYGDLNDPRLNALVNIDELSILGKKIPGVRAKVDGNLSEIRIEEATIQLPSSSFNLEGSVVLAKDLQPEKIDLNLSIPHGPITDLPEYLPSSFREASGTIEAKLNLIGKPFNPQITGDLKFRADQLGFTSMRKPLTNVVFTMSTNDRIINIDELSANLGKGKINGSGQVDFRDNLGSITANISAEKIDVSFMNLEINSASASASISGDLYNPIIISKILIPRGKFNLTTDLFAKQKKMDLFFDSLAYHVDVEIPRNFWVKSSFLNAEMRGKFTIDGDLEDVKLDGGVSCVQGSLFFRQKKFRIDTGEIRFGGIDNSFDPQIYVKSEGQIQSTKIFLTLQGRVSSFTPSIYSTPPMSEGDLLAMLTLGRDMSSAMQSDSKELFETEILDGLKNSYISALIGNTISTALNLDELFLSSLFDRESGKSKSFIRVGKYIGHNIFMAYEGSMYADEEETFIFEYRLPKGFVVTLEFKEPTQEQRIGVRYDWKFW